MIHPLSKSESWQTLNFLKKAMDRYTIKSLFELESNRAEILLKRFDSLSIDLSKQRISAEILQSLIHLANSAPLKTKINALFNGDIYNGKISPAHFALRAYVNKQSIHPSFMVTVAEAWKKMCDIAQRISEAKWLGFTGKPIKHIVHIGMGGALWGAKMATEALRSFQYNQLTIHFVQGLSDFEMSDLIRNLPSDETLFIVASKSFNTLETISNACHFKSLYSSKEMLAHHMIAITHQVEKALNFGLPHNNIIPLWDGLVGRFSLFSPMSFVLMLALGEVQFKDCLNGAYAMDQHFQTAPFLHNLPVLLALVGIWNRNFFQHDFHAILPYGQSMALLPAYLQQLEMESLGKSLTEKGATIHYQTAPMIGGETADAAQHGLFHYLQEGSVTSTADLILPFSPKTFHATKQKNWLGLYLSHTHLFAHGNPVHKATKVRSLLKSRIIPHTNFFLDPFTPYSLGLMASLFEHKVFAQSVLWEVDAFDESRVGSGKMMAKATLSTL